MSGRTVKPISLAVQLHYLKGAFPGSTGVIRGASMTWNVWVQPSPLSERYWIELIYPLAKSPHLFARQPDLRQMAGGKKLPHVYDQNTQELCLYHPTYREWRSDLLISRTIAPWATLWCYYFELWLITDEWAGNGEHPKLPLT
jgi:hypothetical protein